jgi:hypothetical protein
LRDFLLRDVFIVLRSELFSWTLAEFWSQNLSFANHSHHFGAWHKEEERRKEGRKMFHVSISLHSIENKWFAQPTADTRFTFSQHATGAMSCFDMGNLLAQIIGSVGKHVQERPWRFKVHQPATDATKWTLPGGKTYLHLHSFVHC